ncbi:cytochrome P450 [Fusarium albosuccineum]|uniref:Cytochrome P450 n=1 Tax=Fusarium albosuccineum TaxID=1237068 RepID=A0A8H4L7G8_9HYPO|nr:cytochrome P450 [Fusarium albosuccineum]
MVALDDLTSQNFLSGGFALGIIIHILVFRRGEWDHLASRIVACFFCLYVASIAASIYRLPDGHDHPWLVIKGISGLFGVLIAGLFASMLSYRAFFHPLRHVPGPFLARLSSAYPTSLAVKKLQFFEEARRLHETYGDFVRIALRLYEPRVRHYTDQALAVIDTAKGAPVDVAKEFNLYSFDVMGNLAFGKDFEMIKSRELHPAMELLHSTMQLAGGFSYMVWMFLLARKVPGLASAYNDFKDWLSLQLRERMENEPKVPDVLSPILKQYRSLAKPTKQDGLNIQADTMLIVVAGSDTTAASLTCLFLELATNHDQYKILQAEVDEYFSERQDLEQVALAKLPHLQACIDESLRLHPAVPSGVQRQTPVQGLRIGETFIAGNALVRIPMHTLFRGKSFSTISYRARS